MRSVSLHCVLLQNENIDKKPDLDERNNINSGQLKSSTLALGEGIMQSPDSLNSSSCNEFVDMATFLCRLRASFDQLCETYVDVVLDKDGQHSAVDRIADQPIFFLIAQPNDFPEIRRKESLPHPSVTSTATNLSLEEKKELAPVTETPTSLDVPALNLKELADKKLDPNSVDHASDNRADTTQVDHKSDGNISVTAERELPLDCGDEDVFEEPAETKVDETRPFVLADFARQPLYSTSDSETDMRVEDATEKEDRCDDGDIPEDAVYNLASEKEVANLVGEYKRHKQTRSMPPRRNPFNSSRMDSPPLGPALPSQPVPPEIELQRRNSLYRVSQSCIIFVFMFYLICMAKLSWVFFVCLFVEMFVSYYISSVPMETKFESHLLTSAPPDGTHDHDQVVYFSGRCVDQCQKKHWNM